MLTLIERSEMFVSVLTAVERASVFLVLFFVILVLVSASFEGLYNQLAVIFRFNPFKSPEENIAKFVIKGILITCLIFVLCDERVANLYIKLSMGWIL